MGLEIRLKKGESFTVDSEYKILAKSIRNGFITLTIESFGDKKPVVIIYKSKDQGGYDAPILPDSRQ